jgi:hypothetical protein
VPPDRPRVRVEPDVTPAHRPPKRLGRRAALGAGAAVAVTAVGIGAAELLGGKPDDNRAGDGAAPSASRGPARSTSAKPAASSPIPAVKIGGGPVPGIRGKAILGAYLELSGMTYKQAVALRHKQLGRDYRIAHVFYDWTDNLPTTVAGAPATAIPMISWRGTYHDDVLGGKYDSQIAANARRLAHDGKPKFLRWGWEMNGNWYAWSGPKNDNNPAGYIECWKYIYDIFQRQGAKNISWVWSINWNSSPDTPENSFPAYYPGDKYVDWVAISGYNLHHETPATLFDAFYQEYAARKPMMISETGSVDYGGSTKGDWVTEFAAYVTSRPNIAAVCWFDTDTHRNYSETWRIDTNASSLAAF